MIDTEFKQVFEGCETIALVGNSPIILKKKYGRQIERRDAVVRFNAAPVKGYEEYVGRRTTARAINIELQKGRRPMFSDTPQDWISTLRNETLLLRPHVPRTLSIASAKTHESCRLVQIPQRVYQLAFAQYRRQIGAMPSTGFLCAYALHLCGYRLTLYGFGGFQEERLHYFEEVTRRQKQPSHRGREELIVLSSLENVTIVQPS